MHGLWSALAAVIIGAILATLGGFLSGQATAMLDGRKRAQSAALLCGEVLSALEDILDFAVQSHGMDDTFSAVTMRLLCAARREIDVYERNRELMFDLPDARLRAKIHNLMVRLSIPLDRLRDEALHRPTLEDPCSDAQRGKAEGWSRMLQHSFDFLISTQALIAPLLEDLRPLARDPLDAYAHLESNKSAVLARALGQ